MLRKLFSAVFAVLFILSLASCGGNDDTPEVTTVEVPSEIHVTVTLKTTAIKDAEGKEISKDEVLFENLQITLRDRTTWPTILDALQQACSVYEIQYSASSDGTTVGSIKGLPNFENGCFWDWTRNGKALETGKAGTTQVVEGDVYVFTYTKY